MPAISQIGGIDEPIKAVIAHNKYFHKLFLADTFHSWMSNSLRIFVMFIQYMKHDFNITDWASHMNSYIWPYDITCCVYEFSQTVSYVIYEKYDFHSAVIYEHESHD